MSKSQTPIKPIVISELTPEDVDNLSTAALRSAVKSVIRASSGEPVSAEEDPQSHRNHQSHSNIAT